MLRDLLRSPVIRTASILMAAFAIAAFFVPTPDLIGTLNWVLIFISLMVPVVYLPQIKRAVLSKNVDHVAHLALGIGLSWVAVFMTRTLVETVNATDQTWLRQSIFVAIYVYLHILSGVLHITAPAAVQPERSTRNLPLIFAAMFIAGVVSWLVRGII